MEGNFEVVRGHDSVLLNSLKPGEHVTIYLKGVVCEKNQKYGTDSFNFIGVDPETGTEKKILTGGEAKYVAMNIAAFQGMIERKPEKQLEEERDANMVGHLVRITRLGEYKNKKGQTISKFMFGVDYSKKLVDASFVSQG